MTSGMEADHRARISRYNASYWGTTVRPRSRERVPGRPPHRDARGVIAQQLHGAAAHRLDRADRLQDALHAVPITSGSPPARAATTGAPQAIASSAASPNDSDWEGSRKRSAAGSSGATASSRPRNRTSFATPRSRASRSASCAVGAVADHQQGGRHGAADPGEDPHHVLDPLHLAEVGDVGDDLVARAGASDSRGSGHVGMVLLEVHEVGDHPEVAVHRTEGPARLVAQERRDRGHPVGPLDRELGDGVESSLLPDQGDVGAVQRGDHLDRLLLLRASPGRGRRWSRGEWRSARAAGRAAPERHLVLLRGERQRVGIMLEQRIAPDRGVHLVEAPRSA